MSKLAHSVILSLHNGDSKWVGALEVMGIDVDAVLDFLFKDEESSLEDVDGEENVDEDSIYGSEDDQYEDEDDEDPDMIDIEDTGALPECIKSLASQKFELVEVARGDITQRGNFWNTSLPQEVPGSEVYYVMWIEWEDEVAYRRGLGRVERSAWETLDRQWVDLVLG